MVGRAVKIGCIVLVGFAFAFAYAQKLWVDSATPMEGSVLANRNDPGCAMTRTVTIEVEGSGRRFEVTLGSKGPRYYPGDPVELLVDPLDPSVVVLESRAFSDATFYVLVSVAMTVAAFVRWRR
jgi:hypothetical protein